MDLIIQPSCSDWPALLERRPRGSLLGKTQEQWRAQTRAELGLAADRPVVATGHQTLLWHPGILAKYLVTSAFAASHNLATANLVVDQHVGSFGDVEIPIRKQDGSLAVRRLELCKCRADVPMGRHDAFTPPRVPSNLSGATPSVNDGVQRIFDAAYAHRNAPNAALQMAGVIDDLMSGIRAAKAPGLARNGCVVSPMPHVTASDLIRTSLARALMQAMCDDPQRCAASYNRAVGSVPEAGIGALHVRDEYVELPLWRMRDDGRRMRAYDNDVETAIGMGQSPIVNRSATSDLRPLPMDLLPRALFMTALVRLGMCDLFIHGTGGAVYDRAMELWIKDWLGVDVGAIAVVTANLRLPLTNDEPSDTALPQAIDEARRMWHDPEGAGGSDRPGMSKRRWLDEIDALPRNSPQRKAKFVAMQEAISQRRAERDIEIERSIAAVELAKRHAANAVIAQRRDWAFPLYPLGMIGALADASLEAVHADVTNQA